MEEIFRDIPKFEGLYQVSNYGNIKSYTRKRLGRGGSVRICPGKILRHKIDNRGYHQIDLFDLNGKSHRFLIHRLVAEIFLVNPNNLSQVNHKDNNPSNNCIDNLEWCSNYENNLWKKITSPEKEKVAKSVLQYSLDGKLIKEWISAKSAETDGFDHSAISKCCRGKLKSHKGFIWKFKDYE